MKNGFYKEEKGYLKKNKEEKGMKKVFYMKREAQVHRFNNISG
jgi:hypothetical protein